MCNRPTYFFLKKKLIAAYFFPYLVKKWVQSFSFPCPKNVICTAVNDTSKLYSPFLNSTLPVRFISIFIQPPNAICPFINLLFRLTGWNHRRRLKLYHPRSFSKPVNELQPAETPLGKTSKYVDSKPIEGTEKNSDNCMNKCSMDLLNPHCEQPWPNGIV